MEGWGRHNHWLVQSDPRDPDIFWMGSTQYVGRPRRGTRWSVFFSSGLATSVEMEPQRTLQISKWPLFETCFPGTSFPVSETCRGPLALPIFRRLIFFGGVGGGYLKSRVYVHKPRTLNHLKEAIRQEIRPIDRQLLARVMNDLKKTLENCIQSDGRHLTDNIFKT